MELAVDPEVAILRIRAPGFLWGMVRKIVGGLRAVGAGMIPPEALRRTLEGGSRLSLSLAEPEPLLLWEVRHEVHWQFSARRLTRRQEGYLDNALRAARIRHELLQRLNLLSRAGSVAERADQERREGNGWE